MKKLTLARLIGRLMILAVFLAMFIMVAIEHGVVSALVMFGIIFFVAAWVGVGVSLMMGDQDPWILLKVLYGEVFGK